MTKQVSSHAAAAKMIRQHFKAIGVPAKVKASSYSMGSSVRVEVTDINPIQRKELSTFIDQFQYGHFDSMNDYYDISNSRDDIPQVKYTFLEVSYSDELKQKAYDWVRSNMGGYNTADDDYSKVACWDKSETGEFITETVNRILNGYYANLAAEFWAA